MNVMWTNTNMVFCEKIDHRNDVCFTSKNKTKQKNPQVSLALVQQYEVEQVLGFV